MKKLYIGENHEIKINSVVKEVTIKIATDDGDKNIIILIDLQGRLWLNLSQGEKEVQFIPMGKKSLSFDSKGRISTSPRAFIIDIIDGCIRFTNNGIIEAQISALPEISPGSAIEWGVPEVLASLEKLRNAKESGPFWRAQKQLKDGLHLLGRGEGEADVIADLIDEVFPGPIQEVVENALEEIKVQTKRIETEIRSEYIV